MSEVEIPEGWVRWSPKAFQHVIGRYEKRTVDKVTGMPEPQEFRATCTVCGEERRGSCPSGNVRLRIAQFAVHHGHTDPMKP